jgi:hypothetical protein
MVVETWHSRCDLVVTLKARFSGSPCCKSIVKKEVSLPHLVREVDAEPSHLYLSPLEHNLSVYWIPGYPGPPAPGSLQRPSFGPGCNDDRSCWRRPSWGGASRGERWLKPLRTRRPPHGLPLVRGGTTSTLAQHVCVQSKKMKGRRPRTAHATPDREETNFRRAYIKQNSGCWPPP